MQVTNTQVAQTLAALGAQASDVDRRDCCRPELSPDVIESVNSLPSVRRDRTDWARDVLARKVLPSDDDIAEKLVGRLVVDRLR